MKNYTRILFLLSIIICLLSCENDSPDDLIEITPVDTVTYIDDVKPIIDGSCIICHQNPPVNGAPMSLLTLDDVRNAIETRGLIQRISSEDVNFLMPLGGPRLPQPTIDLIIKWQTDGFLEQ